MIMKKESIFNFFFIFSIFLLDRVSKIIIIYFHNNSQVSNYEINSFLSFNLIWNEGIAFGLFSFDEKFYYNSMTIIIFFVTLIIFYLMLKSKSIEKFGFMMILGGSMGNIFDRLYYFSVPDFIDIHFNNFNWFIFNVADIFISLGVTFLIYLEIFKKKHD